MKNLHKKIGAMVLAGMVVLGGVAVSGVNSFAASKEKVSVINIQDAKHKKVNFYCKKYGAEIIDVSNKESEIRKIIKDKYGYKNAYNLGRKAPVKPNSQILLKIDEARKVKKQVINMNCDGFYYLIKVK